MDGALIGWVFFFMMFLWRFVAQTKMVRETMKKMVREKKSQVVSQKKLFGLACLQWYGITGLGLTFFMIHTMWDIVKYDYKSAHFLDPHVIQSKNPDQAKYPIVHLPVWLRAMSLVAPWIGAIGFAISIWKSFLLVMYSLKGSGVSGPALHQCIDQLLVIIGVPQVFVVFSLRAIIRQWEVMTLSFCWHDWKAQTECTDWESMIFLVRDQCKLNMYFAQAFQFYAMWEFGELCGHFMSDGRIGWIRDKDGTTREGIQYNDGTTKGSKQIMKEYRSAIKWAAGLALYAFAGIGMLKSIFVFAMTVVINTMRDENEKVNEIVDFVQHKVDPVFAFATILCVINMFLISRIETLKEAIGENINLKFHGTRMMLLVVQIQPQVLKFLTINPKKEGQWWAFIDEDQAILLNVTLVLYWCFSVSVVNAKVWEAPPLKDTVAIMNRKAREIDADHEGANEPVSSSWPPLEKKLLA